MMGQQLNEADVRSIVTMLGQSLSGGGDFATKRAGVLEGIAELVGAQSWIWTRASFEMDDSLENASAALKHTVLVKGGFTDEQFGIYLGTMRHPEIHWLVSPIFEESNDKGDQRLTRHREQLRPLDVVKSSGIGREMAKAGIGPLVISHRQTFDKAINGIFFFRPEGEPEFTDRETKIAHIILTEVEWLHENSWPDYPTEEVTSLPLRFAGIVNLLIKGDQRKEIADQLNLSIHTVSDYIKAIYKHFGVHSQAELMHRFTRGDGGDSNLVK